VSPFVEQRLHEEGESQFIIPVACYKSKRGERSFRVLV